MDVSKLTQANNLLKKITDLEVIIKNAENQKCEWIEFTFGNGSNRSHVCNDSGIIPMVRDLIIKENKNTLAQLRKEFDLL